MRETRTGAMVTGTVCRARRCGTGLYTARCSLPNNLKLHTSGSEERNPFNFNTGNHGHSSLPAKKITNQTA